jgi:ribonuclease HI
MADNFCTIYCDASIRQEGSYGGFWIRSDHVRHLGGKTLDYTDSNACELQIAYYGLQEALDIHRKINVTLRSVLIVSDNMTVVNRLKHGSTRSASSRKDIERQVDLFKELMKENKLRVYTKHVKGHKGTSTTQKWINDQVDRIAKGKAAHPNYKTSVIKPPVEDLSHLNHLLANDF